MISAISTIFEQVALAEERRKSTLAEYTNILKENLGPIGYKGREAFIDFLNNLPQLDSYPILQGVIVHGRRQIGKSWLLQQYCHQSGRPYIYFQATHDNIGNEQVLDSLLSEFIYKYNIANSVQLEYVFSNHFYNLLLFALKLCRLTQGIFVIDEFNFLAEDKSFDLSVLQLLIDRVKEVNNSLFIICGSNSGVLTSLINSNEPLYGRFQYILEIYPISYKQTLSILKNIDSMTHRIMLALICSGMPFLIINALAAGSLDIFFQRLLSGGYLRGLTRSLFESERIDKDFAQDIVEILSKDMRDPKELKSKLILKYTNFDALYQKAKDVRIIEEIPHIFSRSLSKNCRVQLTNLAMPLFYAFEKNHAGMTNYFVSSNPQLHEFFGMPFENLCAEFLADMFEQKYAVRYYWGDKIGVSGERRELDIVLYTPNSTQAIIGECKFRSAPVDSHAVTRFLDSVAHMSLGSVKAKLVMVSLNGFTSDALSLAVSSKIACFTLSDIEQWVCSS